MSDSGIYLEMKDYHKNFTTVKEADYDCETVWVHCFNPNEEDPGIILTKRQAKRLISALNSWLEYCELPEGEY